jgi:CRISPR type III-A-associated protein Csm2
VATLPGNYLKDGYFDSEGHLRPEVVGDVAQKVAETIRSQRVGREPMGYGQLRSFWHLTQAIRNKLGMEGSFADVKADIRQLSAKAAYAVSREVAPPVFKDFIDRNVELALGSPDAFQKGFVRHFEAVVAFFRYAEFRQRAAQAAARR